MQNDQIQPNAELPIQNNHLYVFIGGISQLSAKKPLNSFKNYDLLVYDDGVIFVLGGIAKTIGAVLPLSFLTGGLFGFLGQALSKNNMEKNISKLSALDRNPLIADTNNLWVPKENIMKITIKKGSFVDTFTLDLGDGSQIECGSKHGYKQIDNIINYLTKAFPAITVLL